MRPYTYAAVLVLTSALAVTGCSSNSSSSPDQDTTPEPRPSIDLSGQLDAASADRCDHMVPGHCLYPFPNNHFTRADEVTPTGLRVNFVRAGMPEAQPVHVPPGVNPYAPAGVTTTEATRVDPAEWNRNDGFSPGSMMLAHIPGVDLERSGAVRITDIERSLAAEAPILVIDAESLERQLIWSELDANVEDEERQALIIRPAKNLVEGRRYIVALRNLVDADGKPIEASPLFRAYRDDLDTEEAVYEQRRPAMEDIFERLARHGVERSELNLAWDFTVASQQSLTERLLHIRDQTFAHFGNNVPEFTLNYQASERGGLSREIVGTFQVPHFLTSPGGAPGGSFNYGDSTDPDAPPQIADLTDMHTVNFRCNIPVSAVADVGDSAATVTPARAALYGHGLFGTILDGEFHGSNVRAMQQDHNIMFCGTDWIGMSTPDAMEGTIHKILADITHLPQQLDRSQQGMVNFMMLAHLMQHEDGFPSHPAFQHEGELVYDPEHVFFDGNSQGGIKGGALVATAPNIHRGVLGVPGTNYSLLLRRYGPFQERFGFVMYEAYQDDLDRSLVFGLMQMLWDRAENNGYLSHLAGRYLPNTPSDKAVLLHVGLGDHLVTHWSAEIMARTIGAAIHEPTVRLGEHPDDNPYYAIPQIVQYPHQGHAIMVWDSGDYDPKTGKGTPFPPLTNTGPTAGDDPHGSPRNTVSARQQKSDFMRVDGEVTDVCGDAPCYSDDYTGLSRLN